MIQKLKTYKFNIINGLYFPALVNVITISLGILKQPGADEISILLIAPVFGSWVLAILFNLAQHLLTKNHTFSKNEYYEAMFTGFGAIIGAQFVYYVFGSSMWQLAYFFACGAVTVAFWGKDWIINKLKSL